MNKHIHLRKVSNHIIAVRNKPHHYGNSRAIWDHTAATRQMWHSHFYPSQLRLVLDLATRWWPPTSRGRGSSPMLTCQSLLWSSNQLRNAKFKDQKWGMQIFADSPPELVTSNFPWRSYRPSVIFFPLILEIWGKLVQYIFSDYCSLKSR